MRLACQQMIEDSTERPRVDFQVKRLAKTDLRRPVDAWLQSVVLNFLVGHENPGCGEI